MVVEGDKEGTGQRHVPESPCQDPRTISAEFRLTTRTTQHWPQASVLRKHLQKPLTTQERKINQASNRIENAIESHLSCQRTYYFHSTSTVTATRSQRPSLRHYPWPKPKPRIRMKIVSRLHAPSNIALRLNSQYRRRSSTTYRIRLTAPQK